MPSSRRRQAPVLDLAQAAAPMDLALQGGGSHGAFTWGVLDRLLQDETLNIAAVSGTSAGALNAAVMATGWAAGGRLGARQALAAFWHDISGEQACFGPAGGAMSGPGMAPSRVPKPMPMSMPMPWAGPVPALAFYNFDQNPFYAWFNGFTRLFSPQQFNPLGLDPLRQAVERHVDPQALLQGPLALFITATAVRTGQPRVFDNREQGDLNIDALLASACLPQIFRPVMIGGEAYWDGGYSGNPSLWPLVYNTEALDLLLVRINPLSRPAVPNTPEEIADRVNEITFNAGLVSELRAIAFVQKLVSEGRVDPGHYKNLRLHMVADDASLSQLDPSSKLNTTPDFLQRLHALGLAAAELWWGAHRADVGLRNSLDIRREFLGQAD